MNVGVQRTSTNGNHHHMTCGMRNNNLKTRAQLTRLKESQKQKLKININFACCKIH